MDKRAALQEAIQNNPNMDRVRKAAKLRDLETMSGKQVAASYLSEFGTLMTAPDLEPEVIERVVEKIIEIPTEIERIIEVPVKTGGAFPLLFGMVCGMPIGMVLWQMASLVF